MREGSILDRGDRSGSRNDACLGPGVDGLTLGRLVKDPALACQAVKVNMVSRAAKEQPTGKRGAYPYNGNVQALRVRRMYLSVLSIPATGRDSPAGLLGLSTY